MRNKWLALVAAFAAGSALQAQQSPPPAQAPAPTGPAAQVPAFDPGRDRLDAVLLQWERAMAGIKSLEAKCVRTTFDKVFQEKQVFEGTAKYLAPNLAVLKMEKHGNPQIFEQYVCTGTFLYEFLPQSKIVRVHEMPAPTSGQVADDNLLSFLFGMKAEEAKRRYDFKLTKEDQHWIYIEIAPRLPADKAEFQKAQLVLGSKTLLPRRLWFLQPNGNEVTWDLPKLDPTARIARTEFVAPRVPSGWQMEKISRGSETAPRADLPPRVIRPNQ